MKKALSLLIALVMVLALVPAVTSATAFNADDIVIIFTNDVHCQVSPASTTSPAPARTNLGYVNVAAYKKEAIAATDASNVYLVDVGDHAQGGTLGALTKGKAISDIMNVAGYDLTTVGNHEFDYGMDGFDNLVNWANFPYISCNFMDLTTNAPVLDAYEIVTLGGKKVAFVGITTPESLTKASPAYFQDSAYNWLYGFEQDATGDALAACVQDAVDAAIAAGADYVVALSHLGIDPQSSPWMSTEIIAKTTGIDVVLDGHSHSTIASQTVVNKDGDNVILSSTGTKLTNLGQLVIEADGTMTTSLIAATEYEAVDAATKVVVDAKEAEFAEKLQEVVATSDFDLTVNYPGTTTRAVRKTETNLGDLCADAYKSLLGADIAFVNGGGVRANIPAGSITFQQVVNVHPFGNMACMIEATGQTILDALEMSVSFLPGAENGGFLQVSGITFDAWTDIPSPVVLNSGAFVEVGAGERRVKNVEINGVAIDPLATYTLAGHNFMLLEGGDGYTMFRGATVLRDSVMVDNDVLIKYIQSMPDGKVSAEYADPEGQGRIVIDRAVVVPEEVTDILEYFDAAFFTSKGEGFVVLSADGKDLPDGTLWVKTAAERDALLTAIKTAVDALAAGVANRVSESTLDALVDAVIDAIYDNVNITDLDIDGLAEALLSAYDFMASDEFKKCSTKLKNKWIAAVEAAEKLIELEETQVPGEYMVWIADDATQNKIDAAAAAINRLKKTGESTVVYALVGVALLAVIGLAYTTVRRREFN